MGATFKTTAVGIFVLVAFAIGLFGIAIFGGGKLFERRLRYVIYFEGSVTGLNVGSPVTFRGVKVGSVSDILVTINNDEALIRLPVFVDINPKRFSGLAAMPDGSRARMFIDQLVRRGLRAQLQMQSMVTGQLMVDLDFYPLRPARYAATNPSVPELPAIPSDLEVLSKSLKQLPIDEMVSRTLHAIEGIDKLVNSPRLPEALSQIHDATTRLGSLVEALNERLPPLLEDTRTMVQEVEALATAVRQQVAPLTQTVEELAAAGHRTLAGIDQTVGTLGAASTAAKDVFEQAGKSLDPKEGIPARLAADLEDTAKAARGTLAAAELAMERINHALAEDSPLRIEALRALREISGAVRSVQTVAEYLQRHPEALLRGKGKAGEN